LDKEATGLFYKKMQRFARENAAGVLVLTTEAREVKAFCDRVYEGESLTSPPKEISL
jgi:ABC-type sugar transport system ATPase subunit